FPPVGWTVSLSFEPSASRPKPPSSTTRAADLRVAARGQASQVRFPRVTTLLIATTNRGKVREIRELLTGVPLELVTLADRLALVRDGQFVFETRGIVEGRIAPEAKGDHGFGYDPLFFYPPFGSTFGEIDDRRKSSVSHRGQAFRALRAFLESHF